MTALFYISALVAVIATAMVITRFNAIHGLLYLIVSLLAVALVFFSLGAPFVAALEVIIYAGAIMVLFVFVIMMLNVGPNVPGQESSLVKPSGFLGPALLAAILLAEFIYMISSDMGGAAGVVPVPPKAVGLSLFTTYLFGVELAGMLLLSGLIGALHLGRVEFEKGFTEDEKEAMIKRPEVTAGKE